MPTQRGPIVGIAIGAAMTLLGPTAGMLITAFMVNRAFDSAKTGAVAPENKARFVAEGISSGMNATVIGIAVGIVGIITLIASVIFLIVGLKKTRSASE